MIPQKMVDWGSQGSVIREIAAYGDRRAQEVGAENVFNFTIGSPSVPAPACVAESIRRLLETVPATELHGYTPAPGLEFVRQKLADGLKASFGVNYGPQDLYLTSGSSSALAILCYALLSPGDEILTLTPYFTEYRLYAQAAGATLVEVPSHPDTFQMELSAVERAITPRTAAMLLNSPNNPSGVILSRESLEQLAALLSEKARQFGHPIYVIADEPYRELSYGGAEVPFLPVIYSDAIYCYSFSKSLSLPGERIGYLALHPGMTDYQGSRCNLRCGASAWLYQCVLPVSAGGGRLRRSDRRSFCLCKKPGLHLCRLDQNGLFLRPAGRRLLSVFEDAQ